MPHGTFLNYGPEKYYCKNFHGICWQWILCSVLEPPWQKVCPCGKGCDSFGVWWHGAIKLVKLSAPNFSFTSRTKQPSWSAWTNQQCYKLFSATLYWRWNYRPYVCDCDEKQSCRTLPNTPEKIVISIVALSCNHCATHIALWFILRLSSYIS